MALSLPIRELSFWLADRPFFTSFRMTGPAGEWLLRSHSLPPLTRSPPSAPVGSVSLDSQSSADSLRIQLPCHLASRGRQERNADYKTHRRQRRRYHNPRAKGPSNLRTLGPKGPIHLKNLAMNARPKGAHSWPPQSFPDFPSWYPDSFRRPPLPAWRGSLNGLRLLRPGSWPGRGPSFLR